MLRHVLRANASITFGENGQRETGDEFASVCIVLYGT